MNRPKASRPHLSLLSDRSMDRSIMLNDLVARYLRERVRRGSLTALSARNHRSTLNRLAAAHGQRAFDQMPRTIGTWLDQVGHLKPSTRRSQASSVREFLRWLHREGLCPDYSHVLPSVRQPRTVPRALDAEKFAKLLEVLPDRRSKAIVWAMFGCGLRCAEVSRLNIEDWSRYDRTLRILGKGSHEREVPVHPVVEAALDDYLAEFPATSGPLIRSTREDWRALTPDTISGMLSAWMNVAGIKRAPRDGVSAHALRHSAASDLYDACHDLTVVQEFLGHRHLQTTSIYLRRAGMSRMRDAIEQRSWGVAQ
jgi:integrase/recombinase XerC